MSFVHSFFDDDNTDKFSLWEKRLPQGIDEQEILATGNFQKPGKEHEVQDENSNRYFTLSLTHLCYRRKESDKKARGCMNLSWVRTEFEVAETDKFPYHINFIHNKRLTKIQTSDKVLFDRWQKVLSSFTVQTNFHAKFHPLKMLGQGSFGKVYMAEYVESKARVAIKAFSKEYIVGKQFGRAGLMNEIHLMKYLKHPNIIELYEVHETENSIYLIMELLQGGELFDTKRIEYFTDTEITFIMKQLFEAVEFMAKQGIMHRDLKAENILLEKSNTPLLENKIKIVDLGLGTFFQKKSYVFTKCGTPGFVAPEILNLPPNVMTYGPKCDIYSIGVIFYALLTGQIPFSGTFNQILHANKIGYVDFTVPQLKQHDQITVKFLMSLLTKDPQNRPTAREALDHPYFQCLVHSNQVTLSTMYDPQRLQVPKGDLEGSFEGFMMVKPAMKGNLDSYKDSTSQGPSQKTSNKGDMSIFKGYQQNLKNQIQTGQDSIQSKSNKIMKKDACEKFTTESRMTAKSPFSIPTPKRLFKLGGTFQVK